MEPINVIRIPGLTKPVLIIRCKGMTAELAADIRAQIGSGWSGEVLVCGDTLDLTVVADAP